MVTLAQVSASNAEIHDRLPPKLVAVFVGATSGIGEYTLKALAKHANKPRVYFIGRSQEAGDRIKAECQTINPDGEFTFIKGDVALLKNVDKVCKQIRERVNKINLLVLCQGTLVFKTETEEGLHTATALTHHSRVRFILNLIPLIQQATDVRRVVSVFAGSKEGNLDLSDPQARNVNMFKYLGHVTSLVTFGLETLGKKAPDVGFVHDFPGSVASNIGRDLGWSIMGIAKTITKFLEPLIGMDTTESGERHLFLGTSARYAAKEGGNDGISMLEGMEGARGTEGVVGGGVYTIDQYCDSAGAQVENLLRKMRDEGVAEKAWEITMEDFRRITGSESL